MTFGGRYGISFSSENACCVEATVSDLTRFSLTEGRWAAAALEPRGAWSAALLLRSCSDVRLQFNHRGAEVVQFELGSRVVCEARQQMVPTDIQDWRVEKCHITKEGPA